jgi:hypothetical protein
MRHIRHLEPSEACEALAALADVHPAARWTPGGELGAGHRDGVLEVVDPSSGHARVAFRLRSDRGGTLVETRSLAGGTLATHKLLAVVHYLLGGSRPRLLGGAEEDDPADLPPEELAFHCWRLRLGGRMLGPALCERLRALVTGDARWHVRTMAAQALCG